MINENEGDADSSEEKLYLTNINTLLDDVVSVVNRLYRFHMINRLEITDISK